MGGMITDDDLSALLQLGGVHHRHNLNYLTQAPVQLIWLLDRLCYQTKQELLSGIENTIAVQFSLGEP